MNSNMLYAGEFYAWHPNREKGRLPVGAAKVRVDRVKKVRYTYQKNARTEVEITILAPGEGYAVSRYEEGRTLTVATREIIDFWEQYKDEEAQIVAEQKRRKYEQKKYAARTSVLEQLVGSKLAERGLPLGIIYNVRTEYVTLNLPPLLDWLQISEADIERDIAIAVGPPPAQSSNGYTTD